MEISADAAADSDQLERNLALYRDLTVALRDRITLLQAGTLQRRKGPPNWRRSTEGRCGRSSTSRRALENASKPPTEGRAASSTSTPHARKSLRGLLSGRPSDELGGFLDSLSPNALMSLPWLFEHWGARDTSCLPRETGRPGSSWAAGGQARPARAPNGCAPRSKGASRATRGPVPGSPSSERRSTRRGRSWSSAPPESWPARRPTGAPNGRRAGGGWCGRTARWRRPSRRAIPRVLRGPQFDAAWCDEVGKWAKAEDAWDMLQFALRLGDRPRAVVTTTPARNRFLEALVEASGTRVTRATTAENRMHLAPGFVEAMAAKLRRDEPRAGGARRRVRERRRRRALDAGDARRGAGAAADRAGPDRGRGRSAGDGGPRGGRVRHRRRRGGDEGAAAGLAGRGDRRRQRRRALAAGVGRAGGGGLPRRMRPTGWWSRSTRAATWSRR